MTAPMPKDNEVDEKVIPVAWIVTNGGETCEPWLEYEQSEVDALPSVCIAEPLYSAATVAELRAEVERLRRELTLANGWSGDPKVSARTAIENANALTDIQRQRADAAERRVGELTSLLSDTVGNLHRMGNNEFADCDQERMDIVISRIERTLTGADPT